MNQFIIREKLNQLGVTEAISEEITHLYAQYYNVPQQCWQQLRDYCLKNKLNFSVHEYLYQLSYVDKPLEAAAWFPTEKEITENNLTALMHEKNIADYASLHAWSVNNFQAYWQTVLERLGIQFHTSPRAICANPSDVENPGWLVDARLNIIDSCFQAAPRQTAIVYQRENSETVERLSYAELNAFVNRVANSLVAKGFKAGDAIAIAMPMTLEAVVIYLGIIKMGAWVVSIADSFSANEINTRLRIANAKAVFTQDVIWRGVKQLAMYEKVVEAAAPPCIVLKSAKEFALTLREQDYTWDDFLSDNTQFTTVAVSAETPINILFSSGTTGDPKAIAWDHCTPIKAAADACFHQDVHAGDVLCWPTNLGWMMGPWVVFAALLNQATLAVYEGSPLGRSFGSFVEQAKVTLLGVVPSLVKVWRDTQCMKGLNWQTIKLFSSTGECSNSSDMLYLMSLAGYKPVVEYCGGTEIGGAYITNTLLIPNIPAAFSTPALGLDLVLLNEQGQETDNGEVALIPPSMGLSHSLLNRDHHKTYFVDMPHSASGKILRRHGDQIQRLTMTYYRALGRVDDTMNLGGIKTSSADIERALTDLTNIRETAAIAITPVGGGPSQLVIFAVAHDNASVNKVVLKKSMQALIKEQLNPLFKVHDVVLVDALPRTASNKIMRRVLRDSYVGNN